MDSTDNRSSVFSTNINEMKVASKFFLISYNGLVLLKDFNQCGQWGRGADDIFLVLCTISLVHTSHLSEDRVL